jgi:hypothetical protein
MTTAQGQNVLSKAERALKALVDAFDRTPDGGDIPQLVDYITGVLPSLHSSNNHKHTLVAALLAETSRDEDGLMKQQTLEDVGSLVTNTTNLRTLKTILSKLEVVRHLEPFLSRVAGSVTTHCSVCRETKDKQNFLTCKSGHSYCMTCYITCYKKSLYEGDLNRIGKCISGNDCVFDCLDVVTKMFPQTDAHKTLMETIIRGRINKAEFEMTKQHLAMKRKRESSDKNDVLRECLETVNCPNCDAAFDPAGPDNCMHIKCQVVSCGHKWCGFCSKTTGSAANGHCSTNYCELNPNSNDLYASNKPAAMMVLKTVRVINDILNTMQSDERVRFLNDNRALLAEFDLDPDCPTLYKLPDNYSSQKIYEYLAKLYKGIDGKNHMFSKLAEADFVFVTSDNPEGLFGTYISKKQFQLDKLLCLNTSCMAPHAVPSTHVAVKKIDIKNIFTSLSKSDIDFDVLPVGAAYRRDPTRTDDHNPVEGYINAGDYVYISEYKKLIDTQNIPYWNNEGVRFCPRTVSQDAGYGNSDLLRNIAGKWHKVYKTYDNHMMFSIDIKSSSSQALEKFKFSLLSVEKRIMHKHIVEWVHTQFMDAYDDDKKAKHISKLVQDAKLPDIPALKEYVTQALTDMYEDLSEEQFVSAFTASFIVQRDEVYLDDEDYLDVFAYYTNKIKEMASSSTQPVPTGTAVTA